MATKEFKEELVNEPAAKEIKKKPVKQEEEMVEIFVESVDGDTSPIFIGIANEEMSRTFLLQRDQYVKVPKIVADMYYDSRKKAAEARRRQQTLQNAEIASM